MKARKEWRKEGLAINIHISDGVLAFFMMDDEFPARRRRGGTLA